MTLQTFPPVMVDLVREHEAARRELAHDAALLGDVFIALAACDHGWQQCGCDRCVLTRRVEQRIGRLP